MVFSGIGESTVVMIFISCMTVLIQYSSKLMTFDVLYVPYACNTPSGKGTQGLGLGF